MIIAPVMSLIPWTHHSRFREVVSEYDGPLDDFGPLPGIYVFGRFEHATAIPDNVDDMPHLRREVCYIGKTVDLRQRLSGHNKIKNWRNRDFYFWQFRDWPLKHLYVSAFVADDIFHVSRGTNDNAALHRFEREKLDEYTACHGALPRLNKY